jgi:hypothetical protein
MSESSCKCHWPGCTVSVSPAEWGCPEHWRRVPVDYRRQIVTAQRQGVMSAAYTRIEELVQKWIHNKLNPSMRG